MEETKIRILQYILTTEGLDFFYTESCKECHQNNHMDFEETGWLRWVEMDICPCVGLASSYTFVHKLPLIPLKKGNFSIMRCLCECVSVWVNPFDHGGQQEPSRADTSIIPSSLSPQRIYFIPQSLVFQLEWIAFGLFDSHWVEIALDSIRILEFEYHTHRKRDTKSTID